MLLQLARCTKISSLILRGSLLLLYIPSKHACINSCPERSELAPRKDGQTALTSLARAQCGCGTAAKKVWNAVREYMHAPCIFHGVGVARISSLSAARLRTLRWERNKERRESPNRSGRWKKIQCPRFLIMMPLVSSYRSRLWLEYNMLIIGRFFPCNNWKKIGGALH